jgi:hypothetical protein
MLYRAQDSNGTSRLGYATSTDGIRFIRSSRSLAITFLLVGVIGTFGFNFNVLLPLEARVTLHADAIAFGLLSSSLGVGALIGALLLARRSGEPPNRLLIGMALAFGAFEVAVAFFTSQWIVMLLIAGTGFAMSSFSASANTRTQLSSPPVLRGRVMSVYTTLFIGTTPIGNLLVSAEDPGFDDMRYAIGFGLRYQLPIGPIRMDYGVNPDPRPSEDSGAFHFSFGFAF